jgi:hypothetical protein
MQDLVGIFHPLAKMFTYAGMESVADVFLAISALFSKDDTTLKDD